MSNDPVETFRLEANDLLEQLEQGLLDLGQAPDSADLIDQVFRALHTIKGSGAMFGFTDVAEFVHTFETAFDRVRKGEASVSDDLITVCLSAKDHIARLITDPDQFRSQGASLVDKLQAVITGDALEAVVHLSTEQRSNDGGSVTDAQRWNISFYLPADALLHGTNPVLLLEEISALGNTEIGVLTDRIPDLAQMNAESCYLGWNVTLTHPDPRADLENVFMFLLETMELTCEPITPEIAEADEGEVSQEEIKPEVETQPANLPAMSERAESVGSERGGGSLRVPAERLDELMDRVGELVIAQARLTQLAAASSDGNLKSVAEELERLSSGLRDTTMGIRMVPIGSLMSRFRRLVHDLSTDLSKEIEFVTSGEETELDKTMIERLGDPLVHLIRNAVDHGLETPDVRLQKGKPAQGTVRLEAVYAGTEVSISVVDDGAGLDPARIRKKAEERGLLSPEAKVSEQELFQLIFAPGFSTAKEVTSLSGRGVGMDVVKKAIEGLRGKIELHSRPGHGTTVTLRLPLTLAIIEGMLVRVGDGRYSIPLSAVEECVELPRHAMAASRGRNFLDIRGNLVPFISLRQVFDLDVSTEDHQKVVIVGSHDGHVGLVVDQIIGNTQTVIKQLSKLHSDITHFSGATILGDGTVALILDTARLVETAQATLHPMEIAA